MSDWASRVLRRAMKTGKVPKIRIRRRPKCSLCKGDGATRYSVNSTRSCPKCHGDGFDPDAGREAP